MAVFGNTTFGNNLANTAFSQAQNPNFMLGGLGGLAGLGTMGLGLLKGIPIQAIPLIGEAFNAMSAGAANQRADDLFGAAAQDIGQINENISQAAQPRLDSEAILGMAGSLAPGQAFNQTLQQGVQQLLAPQFNLAGTIGGIQGLGNQARDTISAGLGGAMGAINNTGDAVRGVIGDAMNVFQQGGTLDPMGTARSVVDESGLGGLMGAFTPDIAISQNDAATRKLAQQVGQQSGATEGAQARRAGALADLQAESGAAAGRAHERALGFNSGISNSIAGVFNSLVPSLAGLETREREAQAGLMSGLASELGATGRAGAGLVGDLSQAGADASLAQLAPLMQAMGLDIESALNIFGKEFDLATDILPEAARMEEEDKSLQIATLLNADQFFTGRDIQNQQVMGNFILSLLGLAPTPLLHDTAQAGQNAADLAMRQQAAADQRDAAQKASAGGLLGTGLAVGGNVLGGIFGGNA